MKDRTALILKTLIEDFIETASPIASQKLLERNISLNISSATVRNEFAILEEVGLIESPHVSAGKVPTAKGYRFFVDEYMKEKISEQEIGDVFEKYVKAYKISKSKEAIFDAMRVASHLSGNVAFVHLENDNTFYIGVSNVLRSPEYIEDPETAAQIIEVLEGKDRFHTFLASAELPENQVKIFIGEENLIEEINSCALLVSKFKTPNLSGAFGILGPMRMKYAYNKAILESILGMIL